MFKIKPLKLTMESFGAFVNKTEIDFSILNQYSLFLITGPTGAGKTTILDAITFALFGEASGQTRQTENFKSDYSSGKDICYVKFEFEIKNKKFIVERYPKQNKYSVRSNKTISINSNAKLFLEDNEEIVGVENVNQKINELIGMTYKQFKQIVVLPQGEFKRLLEAKSEEKQEIFRRIFDTDIYEKFCRSLLEKTKEIESQIENSQLLINSYINSIYPNDDEELKYIISDFLANIKESSSNNINLLLIKLEENIKRNEEKNNRIKQRISLLEKEKSKENDKLYKLKKIEDEKIKITSIKNKLNSKSIEKKDIEIKLINVQNQLKDVNKQKDSIEELICKKNELNNKLEVLKEIEKINKEYNLILNLQSEKQKLLGDLNLAERKINLNIEVENENKILKKLQELITSIDIYKEMFGKLQISENLYLDAYRKFFKGQAGILASRLKENSPCPVCGSIEHPNKALLVQGTPSEEEVNKLSLEAKKLREKIFGLDKILFENYNFVKNTVLEVANIEYKEILFSKKELKDILENYKIFHINKVAEFNNIEINIELLSLKDLNIKQKEIQNDILQIECKSVSLKNEEKKLSRKITDIKSYEKIQNLIIEIDKKILFINESFKLKNQEYQDIKTMVDKNNQEIKYLNEEYNNLQLQLNNINSEFDNIDIESINSKLKKIDCELSVLREDLTTLTSNLNINLGQCKNIKKLMEKYNKLLEQYSDYASLSDVSSGKNPQRISFERYILASYFKDVIDAANKKFSEMTGYRYLLKRKTEKEKNNRSSGLDLEIIDNYTGKVRHINTLSGGESFKASLCLALGLADIVQMYSGGIEIDTLFIDEGFGTLDTESLDSAIEALFSLHKTGRVVGIISHVNELKERIAAKLVVKPSKIGSSLEIKY